jgi:hypothetical protein
MIKSGTRVATRVLHSIDFYFQVPGTSSSKFRKFIDAVTKSRRCSPLWALALFQCCLLFGTRWRWVASVTHRPSYPQAQDFWYTVDRSFCGSQYWSAFEKRNLLSSPGIDPRLSGLPQRIDAVLTELPGPLIYINKTNVVTRQSRLVFTVGGFIDSAHVACCTLSSTKLPDTEIALWTYIGD